MKEHCFWRKTVSHLFCCNSFTERFC